jgi:hypothetical protein
MVGNGSFVIIVELITTENKSLNCFKVLDFFAIFISSSIVSRFVAFLRFFAFLRSKDFIYSPNERSIQFLSQNLRCVYASDL